MHPNMKKLGGYIFGVTEGSPAAAGTASMSVTAPLDPVRTGRLCLGPAPPGTTATDIAEDVHLEVLTFNNRALVIAIGADTTGPSSTFWRNSVVNPVLGAWASNGSTVTVTVSNTAAVDTIPVGGAFQAYMSDEGPEVQAVQRPEGTGRVVHLGGSADTGAARSGSPITQEALRLYHPVVQTCAKDLLVSLLNINNDPYLTGGSAPTYLFDAECPWFNFFGRVVTRTDTLSLTTASGTNNNHSEGITAKAI